MPYIRSFRIEGLAGRKDVCSLTLNETVNVCFGPNGCGKTSLLRILHSALSNDTDIARDVPFERAEVVLYSYLKKGDFVYSLDKTAKDEPQSTPMPLPRSLRRPRRKRAWKIDPVPEHAVWLHKYLPISRLYASAVPMAATLNYLETPTMSEESLEAQFAQNLARVWKDYVTDVTREVNQVQDEGLARILKAVISRSDSSEDEGSGDPEAAYHSVENFLARRQLHDFSLSKEEFLRRYRAESQLRSVATDIEAVERKIAHVTQPREDFRTLANEMFFGGKLLRFTDKDDIEVSTETGTIGLATLSSGEKHLLRIFVDTLAAGSGVILIDEPELSMHVEWQQRLVAALRAVNPLAQMIFATHSPEIMANLPDEQIFRLWHA